MSRRKLRVVSQGEFARWLEDTMKSEGLTVSGVSSALGVTSKSVYEWLRGKGPLHPDHVRAQLQQKVNDVRKRESKTRENLLKAEKNSIRGLLNVLLPENAALRMAHLPVAYRKRYRTRVKDITMRVRRELDEYLRVLEGEFRAAEEKEKNKTDSTS
jgi:predicted transcriptional regulator